MVTQVTLGSFFTTSSGQNVLGGAGGSGLDTQALISELVAAKSQPITNDQSQLTTNGQVSDALTQFQSLLTAFQSAADALRNPPGVGNAANDVFQFTTASVTASDGTTGSNYLNIITSPGATTQSYAINSIQQLATAATQSTGTLSASSADAAFVGTGAAIQAGSITPQQTLAASNFETGIAGSSTITATLDSVANLTVGQQITIAGASGTLDGIDSSAINGTQTITAIDTTNNTVTYSVSSGTATAGNQTSTLGGAATATNSALPSINIATGDSLNTIASKFNAVSDQTGINATVVQLSSGQYKLSFTATATGSDGDFNLNSTSFDAGNTVFGGALSTAVNGKNAEFTFNGIGITRQSNNISNVVSGVTFNLTSTFNTAEDDTKSLNVTIQPDTTTVQNAIVNFVNTYNAIQTFSAQQTQTNSDGTYAATAILANNQAFRQTMNNLNIDITSQVAGVNTGGLNSLASLGITLTNEPGTGTGPEVQNILTVDDGQLASDLASNFNAVNQVFGFSMDASNSNVKVFSATNSLGVTNFTLNIQPSTNTFTATYNEGHGSVTVNLTATALGHSGYTLVGPANSALAGLTLIYGSTDDATNINATVTQGIAALTYNDSNNATTANTGTIAVAQTGIQSNNTTLNTDITNVTTQVNQYQTQLLQQYSALEQAVSQVNTLLDSLSANSAAQQEAANIG